MRIKLLSDLHLEHYPFTVDYGGEDILVLAGDISPSFFHAKCLVENYLDKTEKVEVVYVTGNHDYFGSDIHTVDKMWRQFKHPRFHFLQNDSVVLGGVRFFGSTMWTDMILGDPDAMRVCRLMMGDFYHIKGFSPGICTALHYTARTNLASVLEASKEKVIVITHHLPSYKSIDARYADNPSNPSFASTDLDDLIHHDKVIAWYHGHTHHNLDYMDQNTRVVCNPRGYVKKSSTENKNFDKELIMEIN